MKKQAGRKPERGMKKKHNNEWRGSERKKNCMKVRIGKLANKTINKREINKGNK